MFTACTIHLVANPLSHLRLGTTAALVMGIVAPQGAEAARSLAYMASTYCVCVCVCCVYTCTYIWIYSICIQMYAHTHTKTHMHTRVHLHTCSHGHGHRTEHTHGNTQDLRGVSAEQLRSPQLHRWRETVVLNLCVCVCVCVCVCCRACVCAPRERNDEP